VLFYRCCTILWLRMSYRCAHVPILVWGRTNWQNGEHVERRSMLTRGLLVSMHIG